LRLLLNLALLGVLGLQLFTLVSLGTDHHLRLPGFARRALEARLQDQGLAVSFSGLDVSFSGGLLLHNPKIFLAGSTEPVAEADLLYADPDWLTLLLGHRLIFSEMRLINANFYCPPENSPTGRREPFITRLDAALLSQGAQWWQLDHLQARFLNVLVFAQGTFLLPPMAAAPAPAATLAARYRQWARVVVDWQPQFARVDDPSVEVRLEGEEPGLTKIHLAALAAHSRPPLPGLEFGHESLQLAATWDGQVLRANGPLFTALESVSYTPDPAADPKHETFSARAVAARILLADGAAGLFTAAPPRCAVAAAASKINDFTCDSLAANLDFRQWPSLPFSADVAHGPDSVQVSGHAELAPHDGTLDWHGGDFEIRANTRLATILAAAQQPLPDLAGPLKLDGPLQINGRVAIAPDLQLESADFTVRAQDAHYERMDFDTVFARGQLTRDATGDYLLELPRVTGVNPSWQVAASYFENLHTHNFRITAQGDIEPRVLDPYFTFADWWTPLWQALAPAGHWPHVELSYLGNWDAPLADNTLSLSAQIAGARVRGVATDRIGLRVLTRPDYITVYDIDARVTGRGSLTGALVWAMKPNYKAFIEQRAIFDSTLPLATVAALGGGDIAEALRPLDCPIPPVAHVDQRVGGSANPQPGAVATKIHAELATPFHAYRVPLDSLVLDFTDYGNWVDVPRCDFSVAGGEGKAQASLIHHAGASDELSFSALLHSARDTDFLAALGQLGYGEKPAAPTPPASPAAAPTAAAATPAAEKSPAPALGDPAHPALLDLALAGRMTLAAPDSLVATGAARLYGAQLGQLHLLGSLSRAMADTKIPLGDFNLTTASSVLQIAHQFVRLPNLVITGPTARVVSAGIYNYDKDDLNFNVLLFPLGESNSFFLKQISNLVNPFSNTVTLKLHGKMNQPEWNVSMDLVRLFENHTVECPPIPGYPANADGSPALPALPAVPALPAEKK
jgi:hypothetical protein